MLLITRSGALSGNEMSFWRRCAVRLSIGQSHRPFAKTGQRGKKPAQPSPNQEHRRLSDRYQVNLFLEIPMSNSPFAVRHIRWWHKPVPLFLKSNDAFVQVGWVWNQWAYLVNNMHSGWIAFAEDQTQEKIDIWKCNHCGASIWGTQRSKIERSIARNQSN